MSYPNDRTLDIFFLNFDVVHMYNLISSQKVFSDYLSGQNFSLFGLHLFIFINHNDLQSVKTPDFESFLKSTL